MWTYQQSTGQLTNPDGVLVGVGYSGGDEGKELDAVNNQSYENVPMVGPIPRGQWTIGPFFDQIPGKGPIVTHLTPDASTETFGRSGLMIHGDNAAANRSASEGCIILAHPLRQMIAESGDTQLLVVP